MIRIGGNTGSGGEIMISSASTAIPAEGIISAHDLGLNSVLFLQNISKITFIIQLARTWSTSSEVHIWNYTNFIIT